MEAEHAGKSAADYVLDRVCCLPRIHVEAGNGVRYVLPQSICRGVDFELSIRVTSPEEDVAVGLYDAETLFRTVKFRRVHPAQMIKIRLNATETRNIGSLRVEVLAK
jgi:hypothetical protein